MYLSRIALQNVRGFEGFEMVLPPFTEDHAPWAVILGDNGTGKTTLLRCIAMGLSGASGASSLLSELYGEWLRDIGKEAIITLELQESDEGRKTHSVVTTVKHGASGEYESNRIIPKVLHLMRYSYAGTESDAVYWELERTKAILPSIL